MKIWFFVFPTIIAAIFVTAFLGWSNRVKIYLRLSTLGKPCGIYFADTFKKWSSPQKGMVTKACYLYQKGGINFAFSDPIIVFLETGTGGASTTKDTIIYKMAEAGIDDFYTTSFHELAHIVDFRKDGLSMKPSWLSATGWACRDPKDPSSCSNPCKQESGKAFYCSYKDSETLPSRFGTADYDPYHTDVSINPLEDFAEASRYFIMANDELNLTSKSRCRFLKNLYNGFEGDACYDCDNKTSCFL